MHKKLRTSKIPCNGMYGRLLTIALVFIMEISQATSVERSEDISPLFVFEDKIYYISKFTTNAEVAKLFCEKEGYTLLSIENELENENLKEHLEKIEGPAIDGIWTSGTKISHNSTTEYLWSTTGLPFAYSDFDKVTRNGLKRSARNKRDLNMTKECGCSNSTCGGDKPSLPCENAPKCKITLLPCTTTTYPCDVKCPHCNSFRPNCSSTCPPCNVVSPVCEAIQGPCTVTSGPCGVSSPKCNITTPECYTIRPDCETVQKPCKPAASVPPCSGIPKCRVNQGELCTTSQPPCVTTHQPCVTTQSPCYEVTTPAPCKAANRTCITRYEPLGCRKKRDVNCKPVKFCEPTVPTCPELGNVTTLVCPEPTTTCQPPITVCPSAQTTCKPAIDCSPVICQSPPIVCQDPNTNCPPAVTICPSPVIVCDDPVTTCPEPDVICPEPEVRCSKPFVQCPGPEIACPGVITSCSDAKPICKPPTVICPEPVIECEKPEVCPETTFGPPLPTRSCEECSCSTDQTTPMPDPDAEDVYISGCVGMKRRSHYKWDVQDCKTRQHYICEYGMWNFKK